MWLVHFINPIQGLVQVKINNFSLWYSRFNVVGIEFSYDETKYLVPLTNISAIQKEALGDEEALV